MYVRRPESVRHTLKSGPWKEAAFLICSAGITEHTTKTKIEYSVYINWLQQADNIICLSVAS